MDNRGRHTEGKGHALAPALRIHKHERVHQRQPALGVGVQDLTHFAVTCHKNVVGGHHARSAHVLPGGHDEVRLNIGRIKVLDGAGGAEEGGNAVAVTLH